MNDVKAIDFRGGDPRHGALIIFDQTRLPITEQYIEIRTLTEAEEAIRSLRIRGAPLLGVFSLYAMMVALRNIAGSDNGLDAAVRIAERLRSIRPTAVNLAAELDRLIAGLSALPSPSVNDALHFTFRYAKSARKRDEDACLAIAKNGFPLVEDGALYATHCNTGSFATAGIGTALGILKYAYANGKRIEVLVAESRPASSGGKVNGF